MKRAINLVYSQAYVSVWLDERRMIITTTARWIRSSILRQFQGAGRTVTESNIQGPIHCPNSETKDIADVICELCEVTPALWLADISKLAPRTYTNDGHEHPVGKNSPHGLATRSSLATQCNWFGTFAALPLSHANLTQAVISFGPNRCAPQSLVASFGGGLTHISNLCRFGAASNGTVTLSASAAPATSPALLRLLPLFHHNERRISTTPLPLNCRQTEGTWTEYHFPEAAHPSGTNSSDVILTGLLGPQYVA